MRSPAWLVLLPLAATGVACGASDPPPPKTPIVAAPVDPDPQSSEWLYATDDVHGGRKKECSAVAALLHKEDACKGALCGHGAALAKDWLRVCKRLSPGLVSDVQKREQDLETKAGEAATPCQTDIEDIVRNGCGSRDDCGAYVQAWATRCSGSSTPLVLRILKTAVRRKEGRQFDIDARGCDELIGNMTKAAACEQKFACEDKLPTIDTYRQRCLTGGKLPTLAAAMVELAIRSGAGQTPKPMPVSADDALDEHTPLPLDDGSGAVLDVCGKRAADITSYLAARKACQGEVVIARRFKSDDGTAVVRLGRVPHPDDASFLVRFPSLVVKGELRARDEAALPLFSKAVDEAVRIAGDAKRREAASMLLTVAIVANADSVRNSSVFDKAIRGRDDELTPLFRAIGEAKKKAIHDNLAPDKAAPVLYRSQAYVLADVSADGHVRLGASSLASSIALDDMLPHAMAAYRDALASRLKRLAHLKPSKKALEKLSGNADDHAARCATAEKTYQQSSQELVACAFGTAKCDEARETALAGAIDRARQDAASEYLEARLASSSLPDAWRQTAESTAEAAGCREPWW